jgi:hypothetical protein
MYLATEHANREVGAGKEAYDIRIGSKGVPLVGDETGSRGLDVQGARQKALRVSPLGPADSQTRRVTEYSALRRRTKDP